ncbi:MAG: hypothetical protein VKN56_06435 [Cyanobacteriota bacterium]|nr:hypothetical protein [Cyanobacteriota bacterium]
MGRLPGATVAPGLPVRQPHPQRAQRSSPGEAFATLLARARRLLGA